jgi:hypothetical protein
VASGKSKEGGKTKDKEDKDKGGRKLAGQKKDGNAADGKAGEGRALASKDGGKSVSKTLDGRPAVVRSAAAQAKSVAAASRIADRFASATARAPAGFNAGALASSYAGAAATAAAVAAVPKRNMDPASPLNRALPPDSSVPAPINSVVAPLCAGACSRSDANLAVAVQVQMQASGSQAAPSDSLSESFHELPWRSNSGVKNVARSRAVANYAETLEDVNFMSTFNLFIIP